MSFMLKTATEDDASYLFFIASRKIFIITNFIWKIELLLGIIDVVILADPFFNLPQFYNL